MFAIRPRSGESKGADRIAVSASCSTSSTFLPTALINWLRELEQWAPELVARQVIGDQSDRLAYYLWECQVMGLVGSAMGSTG